MGDKGPRTPTERTKEFENQEKTNLEKTEVVNQGYNDKVKENTIDNNEVESYQFSQREVDN